MSHLGDPGHYQHTTRPTAPAGGWHKRPGERYRPGDFVTVVPADGDPWLLHMQRHVHVVDEPSPGQYRVRLGSTSEDAAIQGPIPADRLLPGWIEQDGLKRFDVHGTRWPQ